MEKIVDYISSHTVLLVIVVILSIIVLLPFIKKLAHLFFSIAAVMLLFALFFHFTGGKTPVAFHYMEHAVTAVFSFIAETFKFLFDMLKSPKKQLL
ncbi:MAG: hypothetical protein WCK32_04540 [Chlorobiaceae bacterium]